MTDENWIVISNYYIDDADVCNYDLCLWGGPHMMP